MKGVRDTGWSGDSKLARFGFLVTAALRFIMVFDKLLRNLEVGISISQVEKANHLLLVTEALLNMADEAWTLKSEVNNELF